MTAPAPPAPVPTASAGAPFAAAASAALESELPPGDLGSLASLALMLGERGGDGERSAGERRADDDDDPSPQLLLAPTQAAVAVPAVPAVSASVNDEQVLARVFALAVPTVPVHSDGDDAQQQGVPAHTTAAVEAQTAQLAALPRDELVALVGALGAVNAEAAWVRAQAARARAHAVYALRRQHRMSAEAVAATRSNSLQASPLAGESADELRALGVANRQTLSRLCAMHEVVLACLRANAPLVAKERQARALSEAAAKLEPTIGDGAGAGSASKREAALDAAVQRVWLPAVAKVRRGSDSSGGSAVGPALFMQQCASVRALWGAPRCVDHGKLPSGPALERLARELLQHTAEGEDQSVVAARAATLPESAASRDEAGDCTERESEKPVRPRLLLAACKQPTPRPVRGRPKTRAKNKRGGAGRARRRRTRSRSSSREPAKAETATADSSDSVESSNSGTNTSSNSGDESPRVAALRQAAMARFVPALTREARRHARTRTRTLGAPSLNRAADPSPPQAHGDDFAALEATLRDGLARDEPAALACVARVLMGSWDE